MASFRHRQETQGQSNEDNRPQVMRATVKSWRKEKICVTKCIDATQKKILSQRCVCVIGFPGAGKSTAIHRAALSLENEGYVIYCIDEARELLTYFDEDKKQAFILDDILGIDTIVLNEMDFWVKQNEKIKSLLVAFENKKLLVSIRTQLYNQAVKGNKFVFLERSTCIDLNDKHYRLDVDDMKNMLIFQGTSIDKVDDLMRQICCPWYTDKQLQDMSEERTKAELSRYTEGFSELSQCFPLLCKVFCSDESVRQKPREFFTNPFQALTDIFQKIKSDNKLQFCGLVLCTVFDGKLTEDLFSIHCEFKNELDEESVRLRNIIMTSCDFEGQKYLLQIKSALNFLVGVYVTRVENTYQMAHRVFHDIVTFLFNDTDPSFVLEYGKSGLICDRVRIQISKTQLADDPYMIMINDDKNIERLADRLFRDFKADPEIGSRYIVRNPNIIDDRLISCLRKKIQLFDEEKKDKTLIDKLFRQCMFTVNLNKDTYKDGDVTQYKLIELCVKTGSDCNMDNGYSGLYPLHRCVMTGSLELTQLLLDNGADKRRVDSGYSVLHWICSETTYNKIELLKLITTYGGDQSVVEFITSDKHIILQGIEDDSDRQRVLQKLQHDGNRDESDRRRILETLGRDNLQLEEVLSDNSIKILTTDKLEIKHCVKQCTGTEKIQLVERLHDNILTYVDQRFGRNILHLSAHDYFVTEYLLTYKCLQLDINKRDKDDEGNTRTPYWYVVNNKKLDRYKGITVVVVEEKEKMMKLYSKHGAVL